MRRPYPRWVAAPRKKSGTDIFYEYYHTIFSTHLGFIPVKSFNVLIVGVGYPSDLGYHVPGTAYWDLIGPNCTSS